MTRKANLLRFRNCSMILLLVPLFLFILSPTVAVSSEYCDVGTRVQGDMGGGKIGTIEEVGQEVPHEGWFRIVFDWNGPDGDWYDPKTWNIRIAGTDKRCEKNAKESREEEERESSKGDDQTCRFFKGFDKVSNADKASARLFQSVIFEWFNSINKYRDFGLEFFDFTMGSPFKNRAYANGRKDVDPAPVGAMIYPLKTKLVTCEKDVESTFRTEWTNNYSCYKNRVGEWVCKNGAPQEYARTSFPNN